MAVVAIVDRDDSKAARHLPDQPFDAVNDLQRKAGMEEHLAHQDEKRDRRQREIDHRRDAVARNLMQAGIATEK